jgi:hypothetical protein
MVRQAESLYQKVEELKLGEEKAKPLLTAIDELEAQ